MLSENLILTNKRTLKEMVSHRTINGIMQTPKKEVHFFFFSVCCIVFNYSWQLIIFDKKAKKLCKTHSFSNWWWFTRPKSFLQSKNCSFIHPLKIRICQWWKCWRAVDQGSILWCACWYCPAMTEIAINVRSWNRLL